MCLLGNNQFNLNNEPIRNKELNEISSLYQRKKNEIIQDKKIDIYRPVFIIILKIRIFKKIKNFNVNYNAINDGRSRYLKNNPEQGNNKLPQTSNTKNQLLG